MNLKLRSEVMRANDSKTLYLARNLVCDGTNYFDTGFAPYSAENINKDFKITIRVKQATFTAANDVILGCKYEGTLDGQQWPGIYFRHYTSTTCEIGGYDYYRPSLASVVGNNLYIWRESGNYYAQIEGQNQTTLSVRSAVFNQNIVIGAGIQTNGVPFRYSTGVIDYIRIELLDQGDG